MQENSTLKRTDFIITKKLRLAFRNYFWRVLYFDKKGGAKFLQEQKDLHKKTCHYLGIRQCTHKAGFLEKGVSVKL